MKASTIYWFLIPYKKLSVCKKFTQPFESIICSIYSAGICIRAFLG